ncbi:MAG: UpxY family transcription antiterminator [Saprospiraceae bacterium]|nr:UpxY family transcription antiterminator [Saprospiraceae bacterium]
MKHKETPISTIINHLSEKEGKWFAVYTKYKCEKFVVEQLAKKGIAAYVPLITKIKQYASRIKRNEVPLINCYVFVKIKKDEYIRVLDTQHVSMFIKQRQNLISIPEEEIILLKRIVGEIEEVNALNGDIYVGDEVEIISGNLTGIKGKLVEMEGKNRFVVQLASIGFQLSMIIDKNLLRLIRKRASLL